MFFEKAKLIPKKAALKSYYLIRCW